MKKLIVLLLSLTEFHLAFAGFPCCRWVVHPNTGQWELEELCESVSCKGLPKLRNLPSSTTAEECPKAPHETVANPDWQCVGKPLNTACTALGLNGHTYPGRCLFVPSFSDYCICAEDLD